MSPEELIIAFQNGEEEAFDQVFRSYFTALSWFANQWLKDPQLSEDIVQDCFVRLWKNRKNLEDVRSIRNYLYTSVRNESINYLRKHNKYQHVEINEELTDNDRFDHKIFSAELLRHLTQLLDQLPPQIARVARMHFLEGRTMKEISLELGTSLKTVELQRRRAIQLLRQENITGS